MDPSFPPTMPGDIDAERVRAYDGEIVFTDAQLARLFELAAHVSTQCGNQALVDGHGLRVERVRLDRMPERLLERIALRRPPTGRVDRMLLLGRCENPA